MGDNGEGERVEPAEGHCTEILFLIDSGNKRFEKRTQYQLTETAERGGCKGRRLNEKKKRPLEGGKNGKLLQNLSLRGQIQSNTSKKGWTSVRVEGGGQGVEKTKEKEM